MDTARGLIVVMLGSALGGGARWLAQQWATRTFVTLLPVGTIAINIIGSFVLVLVLQAPSLSSTTRLFLTTGVLGGFTTYSSFNAETILLLQDGHAGHAIGNVVVTVVACLVAGGVAVALGRGWR